MPTEKNTAFIDLSLAQSAVHQTMPYDLIQEVVKESVQYVTAHQLNARISNVALQLNGHLILMQVYVERKNGFALTKTDRYGTSPTSYRVQVRFPFGLTAELHGRQIVIPSGSFKDILVPYISSRKVSDDVQRDTTIDELVLGKGVHKRIENGKVILSCHGMDQLSFPYDLTMGLGYEEVPSVGPEYKNCADYHLRLKSHGLYPLYYSGPGQERIGLLRYHSEYSGQTVLQEHCHESSRDGQSQSRKANYKRRLSEQNTALLSTQLGQEWLAANQTEDTPYILDLTLINGMQFSTESGLPVIRVRDYQLDLLNKCMDFAYRLTAPTPSHRSGWIGMGVGAGKTFITFALLLQMKHLIQCKALSLPPPYCMAPNKDVANVTASTINRQGVQTATRAFLVESDAQLPNDKILGIYRKLAGEALAASENIQSFLQTDLQIAMLNFCEERQLYPLKMLNLLYGKDDAITYSQSIDPKRLFLMIEAQKKLVSMTGMLGIDSLKNILEQLRAIQKSIEEDKVQKTNSFFSQAQRTNFDPVHIDFNQPVRCPGSYDFRYITLAQKKIWFPENTVNLSTLTPDSLLGLLRVRWKGHPRQIRDSLMRLAFFKNPTAALLLANSGGLGNTYDDRALEQHIEALKSDACHALKTLLKPDNSLKEHYTLYMYLNELFSTIPDAIYIKTKSPLFEALPTKQGLIHDALQDSLDLVDHLRQKVSRTLDDLPKISDVDQEALAHFGIIPGMNIIDVMNHLAGHMALRMTGVTPQGSDRQKLALSHIPIFTPEGFTAYIESLGTYIGHPVYDVYQVSSLYTPKETDQRVTKEDVSIRIREVLQAIMIADEVHEKEFKFLFDEDHPLYKRLNTMTQQFLGQAFKTCLPHRIGMSGTFNKIATKAFPGEELYRLPTQAMIGQGLVKEISVESNVLHTSNKRDFAQKIVIDYFMSHLLVSHLLSDDKPAMMDLFAVSKGLLFSKITDQELNTHIRSYFDLLLKEKTSPEERSEQEALWEMIETQRRSRYEQTQNKLKGNIPLTPSDKASIQVYHHAHDAKISIADNGTLQLQKVKKLTAPSPLKTHLARLHQEAFLDHCFALYLQYALSKSHTPKELSDLVGLQNTLYQEGRRLLSLTHTNALLSSIAGVDPTSMSRANISAFVQERMEGDLCASFIELIFTAKNNVDVFKRELHRFIQDHPLDSLITNERKIFESGKVFAMLGSSAERTGYSHEPVGMVVDIPTSLESLQTLNEWMGGDRQKQTSQELQLFWSALSDLIHHTLSYDEKNQAGGRALRTPHGQARYIEYLSSIPLILQRTTRPEWQLFRVETSFSDIFIPDEKQAKEARTSINFNRKLIKMLAEMPVGMDYASAIDRVIHQFNKKLSDPNTATQYRQYLHERLPLAWLIQYAPDQALEYFKETNETLFQDYRAKLDTAINTAIALYVTTEVTPTEATPTEATPTEVTPTEVKPTEVKPTEVKPTEGKPTEGKPTEVKPAEVKAAEVKPAEVTPAEATTTASSPTKNEIIAQVEQLFTQLQKELESLALVEGSKQKKESETLLNTLEEHKTLFYQQQLTPLTTNKFIEDCKVSINNALPKLEKNGDIFKKFLKQLANIIGIVLTFGCNKHLFFKNTDTPTQKALKQFESGLDNKGTASDHVG
jgi:hypothetical protein